MHFMIETLTNLKNNKVKRTTGQDGHSETVDRMKKFLSGLSKKYHRMCMMRYCYIFFDLYLHRSHGTRILESHPR